MSNNNNNNIHLKHIFPGMKDKKEWVGIAFRTGNITSPYDTMIMTGTLGHFVHCELILGRGAEADVFSSYNKDNCVSGFVRSMSEFNPQEWTILTMPANDTRNARAMSLQLLDLGIPYNAKDLWQCCVKVMLPFETEVDCNNAMEWKQKGVFCSQMCLLFLRKMVQNGDLSVNNVLKHHLETVHSRGCSPNMLYNIIAQHCTRIM